MKWVWFIFFDAFLLGCSTGYVDKSLPFSVPDGFDTPVFPINNYPTKAKIALGKKLFFDTRLSKNGNISCASCHIPQFAFSDTVQFSVGTNKHTGFRNSPSIVNVAYKELFHKDGGVRTLELQALSPIIDTNEMAGNFSQIIEMLNSDSIYLQMFKDAFDTLPSVYGLTRSIASYERSLIFGNSPYDRFINGDSFALNDSQKRGLALFESDKLKCRSCHTGVLFTNFSYQNIGLEPQFEDSGRARITYIHNDAGKFEVPTLRNIAVTAPYMHNGSIETLEDVVRYFERGGDHHWNKSKLIKPFTLSEAERNDLINFLCALSDSSFIR